MVATVLATAGWDPTASWGEVTAWAPTRSSGRGDFLVAEADESDGSFLKLSPTVAVVTNIDPEHLDFYSGIGQIKETFLHFINKVPLLRVRRAVHRPPNVQELLPSVEKTVVTYGFSATRTTGGPRDRVRHGKPVRGARGGGSDSGGPVLRAPGRHNVSNALAAVAVARGTGIPSARSVTGWRLPRSGPAGSR